MDTRYRENIGNTYNNLLEQRIKSRHTILHDKNGNETNASGMKFVRGTGIVNESRNDGDPDYVELAKP